MSVIFSFDPEDSPSIQNKDHSSTYTFLEILDDDFGFDSSVQHNLLEFEQNEFPDPSSLKILNTFADGKNIKHQEYSEVTFNENLDIPVPSSFNFDDKEMMPEMDAK